MKVFLLSEQDWVDFVNGREVVAYKEVADNYYKSILVGFSEVVRDNPDSVVIVKKY